MGKHVIGRAVSLKLDGEVIEMVGSFKLDVGGDQNEVIEGNRTIKFKKKFTPATIEGEALKNPDTKMSKLKSVEDGTIEAIAGDGTVYVLREVYPTGDFKLDTEESKFSYQFTSPHQAEEL